MRAVRPAAVRMLILILFLVADSRLPKGTPSRRPAQPGEVPTVRVRAASGATIQFKENNGEAVSGALPVVRFVPHLVLYRNGVLTDRRERTVIFEVTGLPHATSGLTITMSVETQHRDPDTITPNAAPIPVWHAERFLAQVDYVTEATAVFTHTFGASVEVDGRKTRTPADYFRYRIAISGSIEGPPLSDRLIEEDHAVLMENQWLVSLPNVPEATAGAAPRSLLVHYCDMFPVRKSPSFMDSLATGLRRDEVAGFVSDELVPLMVDAFRTEGTVWGFAWHDAWTSHRRDEGPERLSVALTDGTTWFHGRAPVTGHAAISLNTNACDEYAPYDTLADGLISTFYHELFHNYQRSMNQHLGGDGRLDADREEWKFFSEGPAFVASSVGLPEAHFGRTGSVRRHVANANAHLDDDGPGNLLLGSHGALYWRFLYEQCGGMGHGVDGPSAGMEIVRNALHVLYSGEVVDITSSADLLASLPAVMGRAFAQTSSCPFGTFEESLVDFAASVYALRVAGGRCTEPGLPAGCGFYDPKGLYVEPPANQLVYEGAAGELSDETGSSYGVAFVDIVVSPKGNGDTITIEIEPARGGHARFSVQAWQLVDAESGGRPRPVQEQSLGPEVVGTVGPGETLSYTIPASAMAELDRIGLIITRVDPDEALDPVGAYTIRLSPR